MPVKELKEVRSLNTRVTCSTGSWEDLTTPNAVTVWNRIHSVGGKRGSFPKPCFHEKFTSSWNMAAHTWTSYPVLTTWSCTGAAAAVAAGKSGLVACYPQLDTPEILNWTPGEWAAASGRAYQAMKPGLTTDLNLSVALAELKDVKRLFKLFDSRHGFIKNVAAGHLNWNFGWKPMIKDLKDLWSNATNHRARLEDFLSRANKPQKRHYSETIDLETITDSWTIGGNVFACTIQPSKTKARYNATMSYWYKVPMYSVGEMEMRAILDSFGLDLRPSTIWELIPFSFLVDWFTGIGDFLKSRERNWIEPDVEILDFCHSLKWGYTTEIKFSRSSTNKSVAVTHLSEKYDRRVGAPLLGTDAFWDPTLNLRRTLLATSLLIANARF